MEGGNHGCQWLAFHCVLITVDSDQQFDIEKAQEMGFAREIETSGIANGCKMAFEMMKKAKMIP